MVAAVVVVVTAAASGAWAQKPPKPDKAAAEIAALEKKLLDSQVRGAMYPSLRLARKLHQLKEKRLGRAH
ncbi:MAG TPA: hypothetical protein VNO33_21395, partial [Kofleriaceae bacterium]|nr:hypothetical protein [Kofleriaceae bacterium]